MGLLRITLKMLTSDKARYMGIVFGLTFTTLMIVEQGAIFLGTMQRTFGFVSDTRQPSIWVMDSTTENLDDIKSLKENFLYRVRGVPGVAWAEPIFKGTIQARVPTGVAQSCLFIGIDGSTFIGQPPVLLEGKIEDLRRDGAVIVDAVGARTKLASPSGKPLKVGDVLELNDNRAYVVGICATTRTLESKPIIYTTYQRAIGSVPSERNQLSIIVADPHPDLTAEEVAKRIHQYTGLSAYTVKELKRLIARSALEKTGVLVSFGMAILLGLVVGVAIAGQTFYNFTLDNLRYFATLKAMGANHRGLVQMILTQALFAGLVGWGIGVGLGALLGYFRGQSDLSFYLSPTLYLMSLFSIVCICLFAAWISIRRILRCDPAIAFRSGFYD